MISFVSVSGGLGVAAGSRRRSQVVCRASGSEVVAVKLVAYGDAEGWPGAKGLALLGRAKEKDARTSEVVPIPLASNFEVALVKSCFGSGRRLTMIDVARILYEIGDVVSGLPWKEHGKQEAIQSMYDGRANGSIKREASMLEQMVSASPSEIAHLSLVEKETLTVDPLITGQLSVRREVATLFGKTYYSQEPEIIECRPGEVISLSQELDIPISMDSWAWTLYSTRLARDRDSNSMGFSEDIEFVERSKSDADTGKPVELMTKDEIRRMSVPELRTALRSAGIPSKTRSTRGELLNRLIPMIDESERRSMLIDEAVRREDYGRASELQAGQSERSRVKQQLEEAVAEERYLDAQKLQERFDRLTEMRADPTQDEGSYDRYLDQDEWYKPVR
uniref:SAP domain-containing protein n=2 Tax=Rhodosorus marinus TaxID=101924 RepID=A0A7S2ZQZ0_9RHOD|mmetsp:Transcript_29205/g.113342  ORF Transcript_29205/g.113342 Transcript_29205/m.113342 type:complete len:392 (+) Transcript_29205:110-1285(+)